MWYHKQNFFFLFMLAFTDAEPKYLVAVQPIPTNDVKKHCTGSMQNRLKRKRKETKKCIGNGLKIKIVHDRVYLEENIQQMCY